MAGESAVSLTTAESGSDFHDLIGNHARDADQFYEFVPQIDPVTDESEYKRVPVMALKVTLFQVVVYALGSAIFIVLAMRVRL
ncbi:UNVERIFIED_CONTAM: Malonyl-coenzyme:anthocyanin 5-O-glucoside-6'''-O-malonyltransferase [Sesamum latifolium]|uniref:Malonyl-coenzyme:anthocyanin 5-O-glucoside-6'''-O-malonyltransferase n=1 Tax=Sesamum latifolium TaxID=2727402 RepID=A0AAW2WVH4_9LAMI